MSIPVSKHECYNAAEGEWSKYNDTNGDDISADWRDFAEQMPPDGANLGDDAWHSLMGKFIIARCMALLIYSIIETMASVASLMLY